MTDTILDAIADPDLFAPWFERGDWSAWFAFLKTLFGLELNRAERRLFKSCTGRSVVPKDGFRTAALICGRRAGKSFILSLIATYLACFYDWSPFLQEGERCTIMVVAENKKQARTIFRFVLGLLQGVEVLKPLIERQTQEVIDLSNNVSIEIQVCSYKSIRGYAIGAFLADEVALWKDEASASPDVEVINAAKPAMLQFTNSMLLIASSPYARSGLLWDYYAKHFGKDDSSVLVWQAPTRTMNPSVPQAEIDAELESDPARARAEYLAEWRQDRESFIDRDVVEAAVVKDRFELPPSRGIVYTAAVDPATGSGEDSYSACIVHRDPMNQDRIIVDAIRDWSPPFSPNDLLVNEVGLFLKSYDITKVFSDSYAGEFAREPLERNFSITVAVSDKNKSTCYLETLPYLNSGRIELLQNKKLIDQFCKLERKTARGGRDSVDHPAGRHHDDSANSFALAVASCVKATRRYVKWSMTSVNFDGTGTDNALIYTSGDVYQAPRQLANNSRFLTDGFSDA